MTARPDRWKRGLLLKELVPALILLVIATWALQTANSWPSRASLFPRWISLAIIVLLSAHLLASVWRARPAGNTPTEPAARTAVDISVDLVGKLRQIMEFTVYFVAFGAAVVILGLATGAGLTSLLYTRFVHRESWLLSVLVSLSMVGLIWLLDAVFGLRFRLGLFY
jgi:hypothetical protein